MADDTNYHVDVNSPETNAERSFPSNYIRTAIYTKFTFLPVNLFYQMCRPSNIYFGISALVSLTPYSPISPVTTVLPLVFVLAVTAVKDGYEDYQRHKADKASNAAEYQVIRAGRLETIQSADMVVGDIVRVAKGELFPADLVALVSSEDHGVAYVETSNLDGETNLKRRFTPKSTADLHSLNDVVALAGTVVCEPPTTMLYKYEGSVHLATEPRPEPLDHINLLLRGSKLRNTDYVFGIIVYAGVDTKLFKNLKMSPAKVSRVQRRLNAVVIGIFVLNIAMLVSASLLAGFSHANSGKSANYLGSIQHESPWEIGGLHCISYFILFTYLIPISLFVSVEIVRVGQQLFMNFDADMAADPTDVANTGMLCRNSNINEELGEIDHIFADKTGTLTRNIMELAQWSVAGFLFDQREDDRCLAPFVGAAPPTRAAGTSSARPPSYHPPASKTATKKPAPKSADVVLGEPTTSSSSSSAASSSGYSSQQEEESPDPAAVVEFLRTIALCHTVVPEDMGDGTINYEAESPDEAALVESAALNGVALVSTAGNTVVIEVGGVEERYEVRAVLAFSSDRKRMSVIVEAPGNQLILLIKGADNMILDRLRHNDPLVSATRSHLEAAAREGLRTLLVARRVLDRDAGEAWLADYAAAQTLPTGRAEAVHDACEAIEVDLELVGATAVEDKLQDRVPQTLEFLLNAGVFVWVLTGDKRETAENIGYSSRLLSADVDLIRLLADTPAELDELVAFHQNRIPVNASAAEFALITDGHTLEIALTKSPRVFLSLAQRCGAVICCRVSPKQKADVVQLVRDNLHRNTLAIGDGANDVSMIQTAHVGVGVVGKEGNQAVRASDFAIHEFRLLAPLLVVHGKRSLIRLSLLIQYSFYKNLAYILPQWLFGFYSMWSAQIVYDEYILLAYNVAFLALPPLYMGLFEKRVPQVKLLSEPRLYKAHEHLFDAVSVSLWLGEAVYHALVGFFVVYVAAWGLGDVYGNGQVAGRLVESYTLSTSMVMVALFKAVMVTAHWNVVGLVCYGLSFLSYVFVSAFYFEVPMSTFNEGVLGTMSDAMAAPLFWFCIPITLALCLLPGFAVRAAGRFWAPEPWIIYREMGRLDGDPLH